MADKFSEFIPLSERAVRRDGTIMQKLIAPGWGSSGYYSREVLERDVPKVFPKGTQNFWNHDTAVQEMEKPEGDLHRLASVQISDPIWLENGPKGPGMYAESKVFSGYANAIDEIGEHIGMSIRASGRFKEGEAEGKRGRIITEIAPDPNVGARVDYVTKPGAGGAVVQIFESAPNATPLPAPDVATFLSEAGRVLSKANETKLKAALEQLTAVLSLLDSEDTSEAAHWLGQRIKEALSNNDLGERLRNKLHSRFGGKETYVWTRDWSVDDGWVVFEINTKNAAKTYRLGMATTKNDVLLAEDDPVEVRVVTRYEPIVTSSEVSEAGAARQLSTEDAMSEQELKEARTALADRDAKLAETNAALAKMREQLLLREARDFVTGELAKTDLPEITRIRLAGQLARNPIATDGKLDEAAMGKAVETAVTEARAEIATLLGKDGRVTGNGEQPETNGDQPTIEAARVRLNESLAKIGYGGSSNGN